MDPAAAEAAAAAAAAAMRSFTIEAWTLLAVGILITMLRTYSRIRSVGIRGLQADDYLVWVGAVCSPHPLKAFAQVKKSTDTMTRR